IDSFRRAPRDGLEEEQYLSLVDLVDSVILSNSNDRWVWTLDSAGEFTVKSARTFIDDSLLPTVDIPSIISPVCNSVGESCSHILFSCTMARLLLRKVTRWWELDIPDFISYEYWLSWFISIRLSKGFRDVFEGVFYVMWWVN
nr:RNA-directed DNA polymerase, eukaryota [Tanacetum cinerariifolium]